jgi:hypothetical protein
MKLNVFLNTFLGLFVLLALFALFGASWALTPAPNLPHSGLGRAGHSAFRVNHVHGAYGFPGP